MNDLPAWGSDDLPEPLPFSLRNALRTIGPGAILLAASIGGGEWLVGPALAVKYGPGIFWVATLAIGLQLIFNLEAIRYTLYTGEPILTGFMRLWPGSRFWGITYVLLAVIQLGVPALAASCANVLFASFLGHVPAASDARTLEWIASGVVGVTVIILLFGGTIERMLEWTSWLMICYIFGFLTLVNIFFVPWEHWRLTMWGFVQFGYLPAGALDWTLLAALAATAGSGGIGNLGISNWVRDKGMGMGAKVGAIPSALGGKQVQLSHVGKVFPLTESNLRRWRVWWKYVVADQVWLWALGCFVGMFLNVNLATAIAPRGTTMEGATAGAFQAHYMSEHLWTGFWFLALLNGFWILFSTHLGNTEILVRTITDMIWVGSPRARAWKGGNIGRVYYSLLALLTLWALVAVRWGDAMTLFKSLATVAGFILAIASVQLLVVNTTLLPPALRPSWWRRSSLVITSLFYGALSIAVVWDQIPATWRDWVKQLGF